MLCISVGGVLYYMGIVFVVNCLSQHIIYTPPKTLMLCISVGGVLYYMAYCVRSELLKQAYNIHSAVGIDAMHQRRWNAVLYAGVLYPLNTNG